MIFLASRDVNDNPKARWAVPFGPNGTDTAGPTHVVGCSGTDTASKHRCVLLYDTETAIEYVVSVLTFCRVSPYPRVQNP